LGNTQEKRAAYEIINNTVIPNYTNPQLRFFNAMLAKKGIDATVTVQELEPLSMKADVNAESIMKENEKRRLFNLPELEKSRADAGSLNGAQVTSMLQVVQSVAMGQLPPETAIQMLTVAFGLSEEEAEEMVEPMEGFTISTEE